MLNREDNEALTRTGAGTPMGTLFRRFWLPALLSSEVENRDEASVRLRILGEDLLAFRNTEGRVGIVDAYCAHRRAPLFYGRNEENGLRCPYHGWKFDITGQCVDLPNAPPTRDMATLRARMAITAYPVQEAGGVVWVYMGPKDKVPELPGFEWLKLPPDQVHVSRWIQRSNFMQGVEGEIDTSHISFLHKDFNAEESVLRKTSTQLAWGDGAPELSLKDTPYGFVYGARRRTGDQNLWRVTQWMLPMYSLIPRTTDPQFTLGSSRAWVPIDDNNVTTFSFAYRADRAFSVEEMAIFDNGKLFPPRLARGSVRLQQGHKIDTFLPVANGDNDYLVDRQMQKTVNFSGIWGANEQDRALQESMQMAAGHQAVDRSLEHLVASDLAVVSARRRLLKAARDLQNGIEPSPARNAGVYAVRAISRVCDVQDFDDFLTRYGEDTRVPGRAEHAPA